jgi:type IV pilus biogenesis protein CpaD/CtpE
MHATRTLPLVTSALLSVALVSAAGCSSSSSTSTTTTAPKSTTTTAPNPLDLPATGSVDGVTLSVTSSPLTGVAGKTTMHVNAQLTGSVTSSHLEFQISDAPSAASGKAATTQQISVSHAGTYPLPTAFHPSKAGNWAVTVTYAPTSAKKSKLSVSGMPPKVGLPAPFPQLGTVITAG